MSNLKHKVMEKKCYAYMDRHRKVMKFILMMKATFILSVLFALQVHAGVYSQQVRMSMDLEGASMKQIINEIKSHTEFSFVYSDADLRGIENRNVLFKDATVEDILNSCLKGTGLKFSIEEKTIVIWREVVQQQKKEEERIIKGVVVDKEGIPLPGTTIVLKGTTSGVVADSAGGFQMRLPEKGVHILVFSFVGMKKQEIPVEKKNFIRVTMEEDNEYLDDVVVTGYQTISRERSTGAYSIVGCTDVEAETGFQSLSSVGRVGAGIDGGERTGGRTDTFRDPGTGYYIAGQHGWSQFQAGQRSADRGGWFSCQRLYA